MSKELIVSSTAHETKVAILEDDEVAEIYYEREKQYGLAGSIYKGRVTRVLPGMQSAFVNIGLERDAFLYVSDFFEDIEEYDRIVTTVEDKVVRMEEKGEAAVERQPEAAAPAEATAAAVERATEMAAAAAPPEVQPQEQQPERREQGQGPEQGWGGRGRGRRGRRRRMGRGFPESKFAHRTEPRGFRPRFDQGPRGFEPPEPRPTQDAPEKTGTEAEAESDFEVLPGESLAKYSHGPQDEISREDGASGALEREPGVEAAASAPAEEEWIEGVVQESLPEAAVPDSPLAEAAEAYAAEAVEEPPAMQEPAEPEQPGAAAEEAAAESPESAMAVAAAAPGAETEAAADGVSETESEGQAEAAPGQQASVRERAYGQRFLHRGGSRRMRRRGGRPEVRERRDGAPVAGPEGHPAPVRTAETSITELLKEGQEIIVQIAKEPIGKKGARITSHIALPGRYLVYMPTVDHVGVSRKIQSDEERHRLKRVVQTHRVGMPGGFIVRTAGEGQTEEEIRSDMHFLYNLWLDLRHKAERMSAPALVHHDLNLVERLLRDQLTETFKTIWVDSQEDYERSLGFVERFQPNLVNRVKLYTRSNPIFDEFTITPELEKALRPKVWLKSGGYIVINQTEALVAIDVNTGKYVGKSNRLEDTIVKTNIDAIKEIVRQIRLRDLGGIIVVDFIDMDERKNRSKVMQALDEALRKDRAPSKILQFNDFGLVAITRKRVKQSLERTLCSPCPYCDASGYVKSVTTMIQEILVEAKKIAGTIERRDVTLRVNPEVARVLKSRDNSYLEEIEAILRRPVLVKGDAQLHQEKFDFN
jgi:ribonuclease G